jgi:hypothetical protein
MYPASRRSHFSRIFEAIFLSLETLLPDAEELGAVCGPLSLRSAASDGNTPTGMRRGSAEEAAVDAESLCALGGGTMV